MKPVIDKGLAVIDKCPDCNAILLRPTECAQCGWPRPKVRPKMPLPQGSPSLAVSRAYAAKLGAVREHVTEYQARYPGATKREACLMYLKARGLLGMLPKALQNRFEGEQEAKEERAAIEAEA